MWSIARIARRDPNFGDLAETGFAGRRGVWGRVTFDFKAFEGLTWTGLQEYIYIYIYRIT